MPSDFAQLLACDRGQRCFRCPQDRLASAWAGVDCAFALGVTHKIEMHRYSTLSSTDRIFAVRCSNVKGLGKKAVPGARTP